ncbi:hypothetical protein [Corynebacterium cystitidis]|uniref:hypothetical protein n=1 Tax=Corynebacterium cystitidis TaxID=35757 RepID=UPI00211E0697|nr:hypothetical protein [Corynebacterium cystitidis]
MTTTTSTTTLNKPLFHLVQLAGIFTESVDTGCADAVKTPADDQELALWLAAAATVDGEIAECIREPVEQVFGRAFTEQKLHDAISNALEELSTYLDWFDQELDVVDLSPKHRRWVLGVAWDSAPMQSLVDDGLITPVAVSTTYTNPEDDDWDEDTDDYDEASAHPAPPLAVAHHQTVQDLLTACSLPSTDEVDLTELLAVEKKLKPRLVSLLEVFRDNELYLASESSSRRSPELQAWIDKNVQYTEGLAVNAQYNVAMVLLAMNLLVIDIDTDRLEVNPDPSVSLCGEFASVRLAFKVVPLLFSAEGRHLGLIDAAIACAGPLAAANALKMPVNQLERWFKLRMAEVPRVGNTVGLHHYSLSYVARQVLSIQVAPPFAFDRVQLTPTGKLLVQWALRSYSGRLTAL